MVMHLLANMKYFTNTAKAKFIFIAGREMYDGYLADLTDRSLQFQVCSMVLFMWKVSVRTRKAKRM